MQTGTRGSPCLHGDAQHRLVRNIQRPEQFGHIRKDSWPGALPNGTLPLPVVWPFAYCSYGAALSWEPLQHLVLDTKDAVTAAVDGVAAYLAAHSKPSQRLFALDPCSGPSLKFAQEFARSSKDLMVGESRTEMSTIELQATALLAYGCDAWRLAFYHPRGQKTIRP